MTYGILVPTCLVPQVGTEPRLLVLEAQSHSHWTARDILQLLLAATVSLRTLVYLVKILSDPNSSTGQRSSTESECWVGQWPRSGTPVCRVPPTVQVSHGSYLINLYVLTANTIPGPWQGFISSLLRQ